MKKILNKINGNKKHAIPVLNIAALIAVITVGIKLLDRADAQSVERGEVKTIAITALNEAKENRLFTEQETSKLEVEKLNKVVFRLYTEQAAQSSQRIEQSLKAIQTTHAGVGSDIAVIKEKFKQLEKVE